MDNFSSELKFTNMFSEAPMANANGGVSNAAFLNNANRILSLLDLKAGDSFNATVNSVNGEEINLLLKNGELLQARIEGNIMLSVGQMLFFQVQSNEQNKIVLKPFLQNQSFLQDSVLRTASLPVNDRTRSLVNEMMEKGMSVDKQNLSTMYRAHLNFPEAKLETLSMLTKMQIPLTKDNVTQYENYKNLEYKIVDSMDSVLEDLETVYNTLPDSKKTDFIRELTDIFEESDSLVNNDMTNNEALKGEVQTEAGQTIGVKINTDVEKAFVQTNDSEVKAENAVKDENLVLKTNTVEEKIIPVETQNNENKVTQEIKEKPEISQEKLKPEIYNKEVRNDSQPVDNIDKKNEVIVKHQSQAAKENAKESFVENKEDKATLIKPKLQENIQENTLAENIKRPEQKLKVRLKAGLRRDWTLEPKDVAKKEEIQKLYQRIERQARKIQDIVDKYSANENAAPKSASNLQKNLQFMQELDHAFTYMQLPLKFSEGKAHGDLYVMTNKKNLAKKDGTLTAFLHLDMTNLGNTDIKLTLQTEANKLRADFYLQEESIKLVSEHIGELNKALESKGYLIKTSVNPYEDDKAPIEKMEEIAGYKMTQMSYQSFDIKA